MWLEEDLLRSLSKVVDDPDRRHTLPLIVDLVEIDSSLVRKVMEHIGSLDSRLSTLLESKDQVNPLM